MTGAVRASAVSVDIPPPKGFPLGGYLLRTGVSVGFLDPIRARLLFLAGDDDRCLLISLDWIYVDGRWTRGLKKAAARAIGVPDDHVIVTATHTHSGPGIFGSWTAPDGREGAYLDEVRERLIDAAGEIGGTAEPVSLSLGRARVRGIGKHRNDQARPVDDELMLLTLTRSGGDAAAWIINYGCHPTVLGPENLLFSSDWVGAGLALVDREMGGASLFLNGGAADVSTRFVRRGREVDEIGRFAGIFLDAVRRAREGAVPVAGDEIRVRDRRVAVEYKALPARDEALRGLAAIDERIADARLNDAPPGEIRHLESVREGASLTLIFASSGGFEKVFGKRRMEAVVTLARIGRLGIVFLPGEVMSGTALALKGTAHFDLMVSGYADDYLGYLAAGEEEYESAAAVLSSGSIGCIVDAAGKMIGEGQ